MSRLASLYSDLTLRDQGDNRATSFSPQNLDILRMIQSDIEQYKEKYELDEMIVLNVDYPVFKLLENGVLYLSMKSLDIFSQDKALVPLFVSLELERMRTQTLMR